MRVLGVEFDALPAVAFCVNEPVSLAWIEHAEPSPAGVKTKATVELFVTKPSAGDWTASPVARAVANNR